MTARRLTQFLAVALLLGGAAWMIPRGDLLRPGVALDFLVGLAAMGVGWLLSLRAGGFHSAVFWGVACGVRLAFLAMAPGDDVFRYVWEGRVLAAGHNPYIHAPDAPALAALRDAMWSGIGHPHVTAIYPPLAEVTFALLAALGAGFAGVKVLVTLADLAVCALLARRFGTGRALVYAWNPLALYCFAGGGHYDSLFLLALVGAWLAWEAKSRRAVVALALAGTAVAFKWMALPIVAWMLWRVCKSAGLRRALPLAVVAALPFALGWLAVCAWTGEWTLRLLPAGFARYARSAEFIPAVLDAVTRVKLVNDVFVVPLLAAWAVAIVRCRSFASAAEWCLFSALVLSPMLHAWYFTWLLPFAVLTRNRGTLALGLTGALYFIMCHRIALGEVWMLFWWERSLIWLPFVVGFLWSCFRRPRLA